MTDFTSLLSGLSQRDIGYVIKNIIQKSVNSELTSTDISDVDKKTPVLITSTKDVELLNDISVSSLIDIDEDAAPPYKIPFEPDGKLLKLWLKFENAGQLRDYSYQNNRCYSQGEYTMPGLFSRYVEENILKNEMFSYFNGLNHYAYVEDGLPTRIISNTSSYLDTSFFIRLLPISLSKLLSVTTNALFTKVDNDQLQHGYSVTVDQRGHIYFYVRDNYRQYDLFIEDAYSNLITDPVYTDQGNFRFENFDKINFQTNFEFLCSIIRSSLPFNDWVFGYNPITHRMDCIKTGPLAAEYMADTSTSTMPVPIISAPMQEGKWTAEGPLQTTIYDNSGNKYDGSITNLATDGDWDDDNTLVANEGTNSSNTSINVSFPTISSINSLTEFTISFWYNPTDSIFNPNSWFQDIVSKGPGTTGGFWIQRRPTSNNIMFRIQNSSNVLSTVILNSAFPTADKWYFVVAKWKSGEKLKLSVDNGTPIESSSTLTDTLVNSNVLKLFSTSTAPKSKIALFKFYNTQISQAVQDQLYLQGYHNPLFPKSESIQPIPDDDPEPISVPFTIVYNLDKMGSPAQADYRMINSLAGNNPFTEVYNVTEGSDLFVAESSIYNVAGGAASTDPDTIPYNITDGTTQASTSTDTTLTILDSGTSFVTMGNGLSGSSGSASISGDGSTFFTMGNGNTTVTTTTDNTVSITSGEDSFDVLGIDSGENQRLGVKFIDDSDSSSVTGQLMGKVIKSATFYFRGANTPTGTATCKIYNPSGNAVVTMGTWTVDGISESGWTAHTFTNTSHTHALALNERIAIEYTAPNSNDQLLMRRRSSSTGLLASVDLTYYENGTWFSTPNFEIAADFMYQTTSTSGGTDPNIFSAVGAKITSTSSGVGAALAGQIVSSATFYLMKEGTVAGNVVCKIRNASDVEVVTLGSKIANDISASSYQAVTFTNTSHTFAIQNGYSIVVEYLPSANDDKVYVGGNGANADSSVARRSYNSTNGWTTSTTSDVKADFSFGSTTVDTSERDIVGLTITSVTAQGGLQLKDKKITRAAFLVKGVSAPTGNLFCHIWDNNNTVLRTFGTAINVSTISTSGFVSAIYNDPTNPITMQAGYTIGLAYVAPTNDDQIQVKVRNTDVDNTLALKTHTPNGSWSNVTTSELIGDYTYTVVTPAVEPTYVMESGGSNRIMELFGVGDPMLGKIPYKVTLRLKKEGDPTGIASVVLIDSANFVLTTYGTIDTQLGLTTTTTEYTFTNNNASVAISPGYRLGIQWTPSTIGKVHVMSNFNNATGNTHNGTNSCISFFGSSWTTHTTWDLTSKMYVAGLVFTGYQNLDNTTKKAGILVNTLNSSFMGKTITKVKAILRKVGSPPIENVYCRIRSSTGVEKATIGFVSSADIGVGDTTITFTNTANNYSLLQGDMISIEYVNGSATHYLRLRTNKQSFETTNTVLGRALEVTNPNTPLEDQDMAGEVFIGGTVFESNIKTSATRTRLATKIVNTQSSIHNRKITKVIPRIKRVGTLSGNVEATIRDVNDNIKVTLGTVDASSIGTGGSYFDVSFTNSVHNYNTTDADKIVFAFDGISNSTNYLQFAVNNDVLDSLNTISATYDNGNYIDNAQIDVSGKYYIGGEPDLNSRTRVVQSIENQNSILKGKKITKVETYLYRTTVGTTGTLYCNIRRNTDDTLVKTLDTIAVSSLSTSPTVPTFATFDDVDNTYILTTGDKISIEFSGGNATDKVGVLVRTVTPNYDGSFSFIRKYDEVDYDDSEPTYDLVATMYEGGYTYTPEAGTIPDPTPVNDKDLIIMAGNNKKSGFFECLVMDFRIYAKEITLDEAQNLHDNRYTISDITSEEILMPFTFRSIGAE